MFERNLKMLYNSGIYLIITNSILLVVTSLFWILGLSLLKVSLVLSLILSLFIYLYLLEDKLKSKIISIIIAFVVLLISIIVSGGIYDQSDDGNTYHKETIYMLKEGWNPVYDDYKEYAISKKISYNHQLWSEHYPKTTWILASSIYDITGNIETGKFYNILYIYITFVMGCYIIYKIFLKKYFSIIVSLIATINPIVISQMFSFYVDGLMGLLLYLVILNMYKFIKNDEDKLLKIIIASLIIIISNVKFTGLAYCGVFCLGYYIYYVIKKLIGKEVKKVIRNTLYFVFVVIMAVMVVGSSSYVKNTLEHKNPFYPLMGKDKVDIMTALQPESFKNMSPIEKNFYSIFSKTADIGVFNNREPELKVPFTVELTELEQINYDTRIGGYGVFFSGIFIISLIIILFFTIDSIRKKDISIIIYLIPIIITVLLMVFLTDSWWARYAPQLYLFVLISLLLFGKSKGILLEYVFCIFSIIILLNSVLCFNSFFYHKLQVSNQTKIELNVVRNEEIEIYLESQIYTGILANLKDKNIKYKMVSYKNNDMKSLYGNYVYYNIINE